MERKDKGTRHQQPESKLQVACVAWADTQDLLVDGSPGGAAYKKGTHSARGCRPGRADLLVLEPGGDGAHGLAVELKVGKNDLQKSQRLWLARAERKGWRTGVARSLAEFQRLVRAHIAMPQGEREPPPRATTARTTSTPQGAASRGASPPRAASPHGAAAPHAAAPRAASAEVIEISDSDDGAPSGRRRRVARFTPMAFA